MKDTHQARFILDWNEEQKRKRQEALQRAYKKAGIKPKSPKKVFP